ncbi:MAG: sigma-70 family RNA polymerase sigma factor [Acidobacteria bacterium]|nr:MAG: sigma-70 family RNA polymerase sigma factor [Acidobacteriota bacterium]
MALRQAPPPMDEAEVVSLAQAGDEKACEALAVRFRRPAYLLALQLLGNPDDALDVAQDSLIRFLTTLGRFDGQRPVLPWLLTIVRNRARDLQRRHRVRRAESLDAVVESPRLTDHRRNPELETYQRELQRKIWQGLGRLDPARREILVLRDFQDLSYAEIAEILDIPVGTVMSRLHRARRELRSVLEDELGGFHV